MGSIMSENSSVTLPGKVEEIVLSTHGPEKVKIKVGDLSQSLRIKNTLTDADGKETRLNPGDDVQITIEAPPESTTKPSQP
jgi:protein involved in polysaccharide export with SLBB domain